MGSKLSAEEQEKFKPYRIRIDKSINSQDYQEFIKERDFFIKELQDKRP